MIEKFQKQLLQKLQILCPDFDQWYSTYQYQLDQDDKTILLDTKSIIIKGTTNFLLSNFNKIGIQFVDGIDEVLSDLYNINRLLIIYDLLYPHGLFNYLSSHLGDGDMIIGQYSDGLLGLEELAAAFIEKVIETLGRPSNILEAYATINDCMVNNDTFLTYFNCTQSLAKHNQQSSESIMFVPFDEYNKITSWILTITMKFTKQVNTFFESYFNKLPKSINNQIKSALDNFVLKVFSSILLSKNVFAQIELIQNDFDISKINSNIIKLYLESNDCFLVYYIRKHLLSSLPLINLLVLVIITKVLVNMGIFSIDTMLSDNDKQLLQSYLLNIEPNETFTRILLNSIFDLLSIKT